MEIRYKRDLNSNYMILTTQIPEKEHYEIRMITENRIYGLLPCVHQDHEGKREYYYEITGRQSMELLYERRKLTCKQLKALLKELLRALESAKEYLLNPDHLILSPESVYLHTKTEKLHLCYYPSYGKEIRESFLDLAEYLLGKLDKEDAEGIAFGYELYQNALEPNFSLLEILYKHAEPKITPPKKESQPMPAISVQQETLEKTGSWIDFFKKKSSKEKLQDYVAEAEQIDGSSALFLKTQEEIHETACLQKEKREGLYLRSLHTDYPDFQIKEETFLIGKKKDSVDGCIPVSTISRIHARLSFYNSVYYLEDLNSTNGTWLNQTQLNPYEPCPLKDGVHIVFASVEYEVQL